MEEALCDDSPAALDMATEWRWTVMAPADDVDVDADLFSASCSKGADVRLLPDMESCSTSVSALSTPRASSVAPTPRAPSETSAAPPGLLGLRVAAAAVLDDGEAALPSSSRSVSFGAPDKAARPSSSRSASFCAPDKDDTESLPVVRRAVRRPKTQVGDPSASSPWSRSTLKAGTPSLPPARPSLRRQNTLPAAFSLPGTPRSTTVEGDAQSSSSRRPRSSKRSAKLLGLPPTSLPAESSSTPASPLYVSECSDVDASESCEAADPAPAAAMSRTGSKASLKLGRAVKLARAVSLLRKREGKSPEPMKRTGSKKRTVTGLDPLQKELAQKEALGALCASLGPATPLAELADALLAPLLDPEGGKVFTSDQISAAVLEAEAGASELGLAEALIAVIQAAASSMSLSFRAVAWQVLWQHRGIKVLQSPEMKSIVEDLSWASEQALGGDSVAEQVGDIFQTHMVRETQVMRFGGWQKVVHLMSMNPVLKARMRMSDVDRLFWIYSRKNDGSVTGIQRQDWKRLLLELADTMGVHPFMVFHSIGSHAPSRPQSGDAADRQGRAKASPP